MKMLELDKQIENAHIVVVDSEPQILTTTIQTLAPLNCNVRGVHSAEELMHYLIQSYDQQQAVDLILVEIDLTEINGIQVCQQVHQIPIFAATPVLILTSANSPDQVEAAFEAGALDYIRKFSSSVEIVARVRAALRLKFESDQRKAREQELLEITRQAMKSQFQKQQKTTYLDEQTHLYNRKAFERILSVQWNRAYAQKKGLSLLFASIDYFSEFNLHYGREAGDSLLKRVAALFPENDAENFVLRYDGGVFALILPQSADTLLETAKDLRAQVKALYVPHADSEASVVTISIGCSDLNPRAFPDSLELVKMAENALVEARKQGPNHIVQSLREDEGPLLIRCF